MTETVNVYAHRSRDGYAFVSFGGRPEPCDIERVEAVMFGAFPDDFWGPSPSEVELNDIDHDDYELPVEGEREALYKVGEVHVDGDEVDIEPLDEYEVHDIEVSKGDVFKTPDGPIKVVSYPTDDVLVTDPTIDHPQDARASNWTIDLTMLKDDLIRGDIERGTLEVA